MESENTAEGFFSVGDPRDPNYVKPDTKGTKEKTMNLVKQILNEECCFVFAAAVIREKQLKDILNDTTKPYNANVRKLSFCNGVNTLELSQILYNFATQNIIFESALVMAAKKIVGAER